MRLQINPFHDADLHEAAELLAFRHARDRAREPALPERFVRSLEARAEVEKIWKASSVNNVRAGGIVARRDGHMLGYLLGVPRIDDTWGRSVWVDLAGHAVRSAEDAEIYRDMYAELSPSWVALGCLAHYILVPSSDLAAVDAWFNLSFGKEHVHGIRETSPANEFEVAINPDVEIRRAGPADLDDSVTLDDVIQIHQSRSPVYSLIWPYDRDEARKETLEGLHNPDERLWLAYISGKLAGFQFYLPVTSRPQIGELTIPEHCSYLATAATSERARGRGVGRMLTAHAMAFESELGFTHCITDWRATNLLSSRFWPRQGFRPVAYRLTRRLDERILWAHSEASPRPWQNRD